MSSAAPGRGRGKRRHSGSGGNRKRPANNNNTSNQRAAHKNPASNHNNINSNNNNMTPNAVRKMLLAEPYTEPLIVALHCSSKDDDDSTPNAFVAAQICDKSFQTPVLVARDCLERLQRPLRRPWCLVRITGYVTSTVNAAGGPAYPAFEPFLGLTALEWVPCADNKSWAQLLRHKRTLNAQHEKLPGGTSAPFLVPHLEALSTSDLLGDSRVPIPTASPDNWEENQTVVQDFWMHHKAMKNLQDSNLMVHHANSADNNSETNNEGGSEMNGTNNNAPPQQQQQHYEMYNSALKEFAASQLDRQKASLTSNAGRANAQDAAKVVKQYKSTLEQVLQGQHNHPFSLDTIQLLHQLLCGNGLHARAGQLRTNTVKAGRTVFCPASQIEGHFQTALLPSLQLLARRLSTTNHHPHGNEREKARFQAKACLTYASAVFFGLVDLHPFGDGNGRLARLLSQGALKQMGLPFCVNWFATPAQRRDYVLAILRTRRNLSLVYRGEPQPQSATIATTLQSCLKATGLYYPLMALLMDRTAKAIPEFVQLQTDKQASAQQLEEARAARRARERASQGSCLICFDDSPNIATLCCGKAVHLACIAEWLASNASCPNCRGNFPALPMRPARRRPESYSGGSEMEDDTTTTDDLLDDTTTDDLVDDDTTTADPFEEALNRGGLRVDHNGHIFQIQDPPPPPPYDHDDTETVEIEDDSEEDDTTVVVVHRGPPQEENDTTEDSSDDDDVQIFDQQHPSVRQLFMAHDSDEEDDTTEVPPGQRLMGHASDEDEEDATDDTTEVLQNNLANHHPPDDTTTTTDDEADTTEVAANNNRHGSDEGDDTASTSNDDADTTDETTSDDDAAMAPVHNQHGQDYYYCLHCRNRAALECTNTCCGRCCLLHGQWRCPRHSSAA